MSKVEKQNKYKNSCIYIYIYDQSDAFVAKSIKGTLRYTLKIEK